MQKKGWAETTPQDYAPFFIRQPVLDTKGDPILNEEGAPTTVLRAYECFYGDWSVLRTPGKSEPPVALTCKIAVGLHQETVKISSMYALQCICFKRPAKSSMLVFDPVEAPEKPKDSTDGKTQHGSPEPWIRCIILLLLLCLMCTPHLWVTMIAGILLCALVGDTFRQILRSETFRLMVCAFVADLETNSKANVKRMIEVAENLKKSCGTPSAKCDSGSTSTKPAITASSSQVATTASSQASTTDVWCTECPDPHLC